MQLLSFYSAMMKEQQKRARSLCGRILVVIRTTAILHSLLLLASVSATSRSSGPGKSSCGQEFHHPDPESCASFLVLRVVCSSSPQVTVQRRLCPMGLHFHRLSKTCEFPWNADCRLSHSVSPSIPTRPLHSTINWNQIRPTVGIPSEGSTVGSRSSTGSYVGASTELVETTTDFKTLETITNHSDQSGATVSPLFSVSEAGTVNREEMTTMSSEVTLNASSAIENKSQIKTTASVAFKTLPTSEANIQFNESVATMVVTASTGAADSTLGFGAKRVSEYSVRPTTVHDEFTYNTVLQTQFNSEDRRLQNTTTRPENSSRPTTMSNETIRKPVTISTVLAESTASAEFTSTETETIFTSQNMDTNIYSTALPEYSQENMTENVTTSVRSGTAETTSRIRTRNTSRGETSAVREITAGVEEYSQSPATAEIFTTQIMTKDNVIVTVDENDSFTGVGTTGYGILTTKLAEDNATLVTRLLEVSQAMTTPDGISTLATEIAERTPNSVARTTETSSNTTKTSNSEPEVPLEMPTV